jgi:hypothetical protein
MNIATIALAIVASVPRKIATLLAGVASSVVSGDVVNEAREVVVGNQLATAQRRQLIPKRDVSVLHLAVYCVKDATTCNSDPVKLAYLYCVHFYRSPLADWFFWSRSRRFIRRSSAKSVPFTSRLNSSASALVI